MPTGALPLSPASLPEPAFDPDAARRAVADVLSRPEFADLRPGLVDRVLDAVARRVAEALGALEGTALGTTLGAVVLAAALALLALLLARFARGVRRDTAAGVAVDGQLGRGPGDWFAEAQRHEREGSLRQALRCRYRGLVATLAEAGIVEEVAGRTTGEYLALVRAGAPTLAEPFVAVTDAFERAWYAGADVEAAEFAALREREDEILRALRRPVTTGGPPAAGGSAPAGVRS